MAGGGLDDELLALAGGSAPQIDLSSDADDRVRSSSSLKRAPSSKTSSSLAKKRRMDLLDESGSGSDAHAHAHAHAPASRDNRIRIVDDDDDDDDDAPGSSDGEVKNPYPYQAIYRSASDMEQLMSMTELEREDILARRRDELNRRRQKYELAALVKAQKAAAGATKRAVKKKNKNKKTTTTTTTTSTTKTTKTKRVVRGGKRRGGGGDSDDESDLSSSHSDSDQDEDDDDDDDGRDSDFDYGGGAASAAKSRKKKLPGQTDAKSAKLSELRKKRSEKAAGISRKTVDSDDEAKSRSRRGYASHSSGDDVGYSDFSDQDLYGRSKSRKDSSRRARRYSDDEAAPSGTAEPSLADLNAARISRDHIESRLYAPRWKEALTGAFIRFSWGKRARADGRGEEEVYRIHQITDVVERPGKFYDLSDDRSARWCNVYLVFEHDGSEHEAKLNMLSRHEFTESERERWLAFLNGVKQRVPKANAVANKAHQLERFFTTSLTEQDIAKVLQHKKRVRQEAISVMGASAVVGATVGFGSKPVDSLGTSTPTQTHTPGTPGTPGTPNAGSVKAQSLEQRLAAVNERNRAIDRTRSSQVERNARASKLAAIAKEQEEAKDINKSNAENNHEHDQQGVRLTNAKPGRSGMGNGFVAVKNFATTVDVDLGDF